MGNIYLDDKDQSHYIDKAREIITRRLNEDLGVNSMYIERLMKYPEFFTMSYWIDHFEYKYFLKSKYITGKILDFGCGSGHMDVIMGRYGKNIHGIDLSTMAIEIADYVKDNESKEVQNLVSFEMGDVTNDPKVFNEFDSCMSTHVFEHIKDPGPIIDGIRKRMKPGAYMLTSVPLGYAYDDTDHVNHFMDEHEMKSYFSPYVDVVDIDIDYRWKVIRTLSKF